MTVHILATEEILPLDDEILPIEETPFSLPVDSPQDKLQLLNFEYRLIQLGEDKEHIRKVLLLFQKTRHFTLASDDEWREFVRIWDEGLGQDSRYNAILDLVCTSDLRQMK